MTSIWNGSNQQHPQLDKWGKEPVECECHILEQKAMLINIKNNSWKHVFKSIARLEFTSRRQSPAWPPIVHNLIMTSKSILFWHFGPTWMYNAASRVGGGIHVVAGILVFNLEKPRGHFCLSHKPLLNWVLFTLKCLWVACKENNALFRRGAERWRAAAAMWMWEDRESGCMGML